MVLSLRVVSVGQLMLPTSFYTLNLLEYKESRESTRDFPTAESSESKKTKKQPAAVCPELTTQNVCEQKVG